MQSIYTNHIVSVTELKKNFSNILAQANDNPVAILNHNKAEAYIMSSAYYEKLMDLLEDIEDKDLILERQKGSFVEVNIDEL